MNHTNIKNQTLINANRVPGVKLWPNPTGLAWNGTVVNQYTKNGKRYLLLESPRPVKYGLGAGILDTIGFKTEEIGRVLVPRFVSFDAKTEGDRLNPGQKNFITMVTKYGGIASEIRDPGQVFDILNTPLKII